MSQSAAATRKSTGRFPITGFFSFLILGVKTYFLGHFISPEAPFSQSVAIAIGDLPTLGVILTALLFVLAADSLRPSALRKTLLLSSTAALGSLVFLYLLDTVCLFAIDERLTWAHLEKFIGESSSIIAFVRPWHALSLALFVATWAVWIPAGRFALPFTVVVISLCALLPKLNFSLSPSFLLPYRSTLITGFLQSSDPGDASSEYAEHDLAAFARTPPAIPEPHLFPGDSNYILLVIESLSNIDSMRLSGMKDSLPQFDRISKEGLLFSNFFSNTRQSEGAMIALFNAMVPLPFPGSSGDWYTSFRSFPAIPKMLVARGYQTEALSTFPTSFLNYGDYLTAAGFSVVSGRDEVEAFRKAPRITFDSPSDRVLYQEALKRIRTQRSTSKPLFLSIFTASSHLPWHDPLKRPGDVQANVWNYVDTEFGEFYEGLKADRFFENGFLIVLGDHRKRVPRELQEIAKFGEASSARVPLLIVGPDIPRGVIDRRSFQQADLFTSLGKVLQPEQQLSTHLLFLDDPPFHYVSFQESNQGGFSAYPFRLRGTTLGWEEQKPKNAKELEFYIHRQRALSQEMKKAG